MNFQSEIYLQNAFRELDAFSLPEIGTFRKVHRAAQLDEQSQQVLPPMVEIELDPTVQPALLFDRYLVNNLQMPIEEADGIVREIRSDMVDHLKQAGRFEVPMFGYLQVQGPGNVHFQPHGQGNEELANEYFGLQALPFTKSQTQLAFSQEKPIVMNSTPSSPPDRSARSIIWKSALLVFLLGTMGFYLVKPTPFFIQRSTLAQGVKVRMQVPETYAGGVETESQAEPLAKGQSAPIADAPQELPETSSSFSEREPLAEGPRQPLPVETSPTQPQSSPNARLAAPANEGNVRGLPEAKENGSQPSGPVSLTILDTNKGQKESEDTPASTARKAAPTANFHLIVGSFSSQQRANELVRQLKKESYDPIILFPASGSSEKYRVSVFRNGSRQMVEKFSTRWTQEQQSNGWIFEEIR